MIDLTEYGYNKFLNRPRQDSQIIEHQISPDEFDWIAPEISANKVNSGQAVSLNNQMTIDFDKGEIILRDGGIVKTEIKKFLDSSFGIRVYNAQGDAVVNQTG